MALIICPECGREISDKAPWCIHCGYPLSDLVNYKYKSLVMTSFDSKHRVKLVNALCELGIPFSQACNCLNFMPATIIDGLTETECDEIMKRLEPFNVQLRVTPDYRNREHNEVWQNLKDGKPVRVEAFDSAEAENALRRKVPRCPRCGCEQLEILNKFGYSLVLGWHGSSSETVTVCKSCGHKF